MRTVNRSTARRFELRNLVKRGRVWYFKKMVNGRQTYQSLGTPDLEMAKLKRNELEGLAKASDLQALRGLRVHRVEPTVGVVLARYASDARSVADRLEPATITRNVNTFRLMLRWALGEGADPDRVRVSELTGDLVARFKARFLAQAGEDRQALEARRRSAASVLRQARSVFARKMRPLYRDLELPDLDDFLTAGRISAETRIHRPIEAPVLNAMATAADELRTQQPALWLVHVLAKHAGLRNNEMAEVRVEWLHRSPWGQYFLSVITRPYFEPKGAQGHVPVTAAWVAAVAPFAQGKGPQDFLVPAPSKTARQKLIYREHAAWMRRWLPADQFAKAGYELRRWSAQIIEAQYGRDAAEAFLRHAPKSVAERHYFERWFPWRRFGQDVGVTFEDARPQADPQVIGQSWLEGASAWSAPAAEFKQPPWHTSAASF